MLVDKVKVIILHLKINSKRFCNLLQNTVKKNL